jgi:hypothetical protein
LKISVMWRCGSQQLPKSMPASQEHSPQW